MLGLLVCGGAIAKEAAQVADGPKVLGFDVEKSDVGMPMGPLKVVGESSLEVSLHTDVLATIKVAVVGEQ